MRVVSVYRFTPYTRVCAKLRTLSTLTPSCGRAMTSVSTGTLAEPSAGPPAASCDSEVDTMFGKSRACGHQSTSPFRARCTCDRGHTGQHSARGMKWGNDGRIKFGARGGKRR